MDKKVLVGFLFFFFVFVGIFSIKSITETKVNVKVKELEKIPPIEAVKFLPDQLRVKTCNYATITNVHLTTPPCDNVYLYKRDIPEVWKMENLSFGYGNKKNCCFPKSFYQFKKNYKEIELLGQGSFGKVFKIKTHCCGARYAMKVVELTYSSRIFKEHFYTEEVYFAKYFQLNPLPHVIKSHYVYYDDQLYLIYELLEQRSLANKAFIGLNYNTKYVDIFIKSLFIAIATLHKKNIIHSDIKPDNICMDKNYILKLIDFGISVNLDSGLSNMRGKGGTILYMPPEMLMPIGFLSVASDWWAFGVTLYVLFEGYYPYKLPHSWKKYIGKNIKEELFDNNFREITNRMLSKDLKDLIKRLLDPDMDSRLGVGDNATNDILQHPYFKGKNLEEIIEKY